MRKRGRIWKGKKAALSTQQIVVLTVLIVSFIIVLLFLFRLGLGEETKKQLCRDSVLQRGSTVLSSEAIPLNCKQSYICISQDNNCDNFAGNPDSVVEVDSKDEVYDALAEEMADCWSQFGEGKVRYVDDTLFSELSCSICSQVVFDSSIKELMGADSFSQKELYEYLIKDRPGKTMTYSEYIFGFNYDNPEDLLAEGTQFGLINLDSPYYVLMGISSDISTLKWVGVGAAVLAGGAVLWALVPLTSIGLLTTGGALFVGGSATVGGTVGGVFAGITDSTSAGDFLRPTIIGKNSEEFSKIQCNRIVTIP